MGTMHKILKLRFALARGSTLSVVNQVSIEAQYCHKRTSFTIIDVCQGACMPIDFVELLHGEALNTMGTTERFLCKLMPFSFI